MDGSHPVLSLSTHRRIGQESGFSLLEVLVVMVCLTIVMTTVLFAARTGWRGTTASVRQSDATTMITEHLERMRQRIAANPGTAFPPSDSTAAPSNAITVKWTVADIGITDVRMVTFVAQWGHAPGKDSLVVATCIAKNY